LQLQALDTAQVIADMNLPGFSLHSLKGSRLTFKFRDGNVYVPNYEDYH